MVKLSTSERDGEKKKVKVEKCVWGGVRKGRRGKEVMFRFLILSLSVIPLYLRGFTALLEVNNKKKKILNL